MDIQNFDQGNSLQQHAENGYDGGSFESKMDYDITGSTEASLEWVHDSGANSGVLKDKTLLLDKNPGFTKLDDSGKTVHASFLGELKRRSVVHVGASYLIATWLIAQVADVIGEIFEVPSWALRGLLIALAIGLPVALIVAWVFELTKEGLKWDSDVSPGESLARQRGRSLDFIIIGILAVTVGALLLPEDSAVCNVTTQASVSHYKQQPESSLSFTFWKNLPH